MPTAGAIAAWITRPREAISQADRAALLQVRLACSDIARACDLAWAFLEMARHQRGTPLLEWIRQAEQDAPQPMHSFASYRRQDLAAVTADLTLEWSSGKVEGHVNRIKTIKRAMYGRATFKLLRSRILARPEP
ncbi:transposase [Streptomyces sp. NPDC002285]